MNQLIDIAIPQIRTTLSADSGNKNTFPVQNKGTRAEDCSGHGH
jgi:hypothetical protein